MLFMIILDIQDNNQFMVLKVCGLDPETSNFLAVFACYYLVSLVLIFSLIGMMVFLFILLLGFQNAYSICHEHMDATCLIQTFLAFATIGFLFVIFFVGQWLVNLVKEQEQERMRMENNPILVVRDLSLNRQEEV